MAQSVVGALRVNLGLDSAQFERGASRVGKTTQKIGVDFRALARVAAGVGAALGALGVSAVSSAREIQRLSQVSNSSPEQFQRMAVAAETVGIQQEKLADILKDTTDRVGDFLVTGGGPMADFFEQIAPKVGVTADQFARLSGPEALQLYVSSLEKAGVSQQKMTFFMEAIAGDATLLLPLLRDNGAEMGRLGDQAAALGAVMSSETIEALARVRNSFSQVSVAMTGARNIIVAQLAPAMGRLADAIVLNIQEGGTFRTVVNALAIVARQLANVLDLVSENLDFLIDLFKVFVAAKIVVYVAAIGRAMIVLARSIRATGLIMVAFSSILRVKITALALAAAIVAKLTGNFDNLTDFVERTGAALEAALPESLRSGLDSLRQEVTGLGDDLLGTAQIAENDFFNAEMDAADAADSFGTAARGASKGVEKLAENTELAELASERYGSMASGALADVVLGAQSAQDAMKGLADQLLRMALDSSLNNLFAALAGDGTGQGILGAIGGAFGGARAMGGPVTGGKTYLVGERGPELFTPSSSGGITPNHAMGGAPAQITINNYSGQPVETQRGPNGRIDVTIGKQMAAALRGDPDVRRAMAQGYGLTGAG